MNQEALAPFIANEVRLGELSVAVRDGQADATHSSVFIALLQETQFGTTLHTGVTPGAQTYLFIVDRISKMGDSYD